MSWGFLQLFAHYPFGFGNTFGNLSNGYGGFSARASDRRVREGYNFSTGGISNEYQPYVADNLNPARSNQSQDPCQISDLRMNYLLAPNGGIGTSYEQTCWNGFLDRNNGHSQKLHLPEVNNINSELLEEASNGENNSNTKALQVKSRCSCNNSQCKNGYCECFKKYLQCTQACGCKQCHNNTQDSISRRPRRKSQNGCKCAKTRCQMKYCHCYNGGVGCSAECQCQGCQNNYGPRPGTEAIAAESAALTTETAVQQSHEDDLNSLMGFSDLYEDVNQYFSDFSDDNNSPMI